MALYRKTKGLAKRRATRKGYERAVKTSKPGQGPRFAAGKAAVAAGLKPGTVRPGQTREQAAAGIMAAAGRAKYGKAQMGRWSAAGRRRAR